MKLTCACSITLAQFKSEAGPTLKKVQDELQKQVNDFLKVSK